MTTTFRVSRPVRFGSALLVLGLAFAGVACSAPRPGNQSSPAAAAPAASADTDVERLTASLRAAMRAHDMRLYHQFRNELSVKLGTETIKAADAQYRQVLANLAAAQAAGDVKARADFRTQLRALCSPTKLTSAIEFCEADLAALGG